MRVYESTPRAALREAKRLGKLKGAGCADVQYLPGGGRDTAPDAKGRAAAMLADYADDCPDWARAPDWLSGEWADEPLTQDITAACGIDEDRDPDGETANEVADVYIAAADDAWLGAILAHLRAVAKGDA